MSTPRISIIIPLHNGAETVLETLNAVLAQSLVDWELIVVDDASTDGGPEVVRRWADTTRRAVRVLPSISPVARGPSATRNRGLAAATAPLVALLDADDLWDTGYLVRRVQELEADPRLGLVWGPSRYWYPDDPDASFTQPMELGDRYRTFGPGRPLADWLSDLRRTPCTCATVFRRDALEAVGGFPESLRRGEDIAACILVAADHPTAYDPATLTRYRRHQASATAKSARTGHQSIDDLEFGLWAVAWSGTRPERSELAPVVGRCLHSITYRAVQGLRPLPARIEITRTILGRPGARGRWWALGLDWVLPLRWSRRIAGRLERTVRHDGDCGQSEQERHQSETGGTVRHLGRAPGHEDDGEDPALR